MSNMRTANTFKREDNSGCTQVFPCFWLCSKRLAVNALVLGVASHVTMLTILKEDDVICHFLRAAI